MAEGLYAPGHLGELTQIVPFEMVDAVLADTGGTQHRLRKLPARVVVYLLLAAVLFEESGYLGVWRRLTGPLTGLGVPTITATALWHARTRLGTGPLRALFDLLRGPVAGPRTAGARWRGLLVCAIDGTCLDIPDSPRARARYPKTRNQYGTAGYPQIRLTALVACGTRAVIDAAFGPCTHSETRYGRRLMRSLHQNMIVLLDRGFSINTFLNAVTDTGADYLARLNANRKPPVCRRLPDGSFLSVIAGTEVRIIECEITTATITGNYRLATTLTDHHRYPVCDLVRLYHERWEIESAYYEIKKTMLGHRVLRSRTPAGIAQEIYALLTVYQLIRIAITDATDTTGTNPDRASFTIAIQTARDQVTQAANITATTTIDLIGTIGHHILHNPMPNRRLRLNPRTTKRPISRYAYNKPKTSHHNHEPTITITIHTPPTNP